MKIINQHVSLMTNISTNDVYRNLEKIGRTAYKSDHNNPDNDIEITKGFIERLIGWNHLGILEHEIVSFRVTTDRAIANELVRHRIASYLQESTRYVKYTEGLTVICPFGNENNKHRAIWGTSIIEAEKAYAQLIEFNASAQMARSVLPLSLATEIVVTMNLRSWLNFFELRMARAAHPQMREIATTMHTFLVAKLPIIFKEVK